MLFRILFWLNIALFSILIFYSFAGLANNAQIKTDFSTALLILVASWAVLIGAAVLNARGNRLPAMALLGLPLGLFVYAILR